MTWKPTALLPDPNDINHCLGPNNWRQQLLDMVKQMEKSVRPRFVFFDHCLTDAERTKLAEET